MKFSVVIPAFNEDAQIAPAVHAVQSQVLKDGDSLEVIVVDNNSSDGTRNAAVIALGGKGKVVSEKQPGPNFARQRGFLESTGDVICFIDSDCRIPDDWIASIRVEIEKGAIAVSGPYFYGFSTGYQLWLNKLYTRVILPALPSVLRVLFWRRAAILIGGNFAATREALHKIGGIPPIKFWGDDAVLAMMLARSAGKVKFSQKVWAQSSPRRFDESGFWRVNYEYARAYFHAFFTKDCSTFVHSVKIGERV
ncbi:MAG TPA: glycosyltransferase [Candidatus Kryptonia bacterium]